MTPWDLQQAIEHKYSKQKIRGYLAQDCEDLKDLLDKAKDMLIDFMEEDHPYQSKNIRLAKLSGQNIDSLMIKIMSILLLMEREELITSTVGRIQQLFDYEEPKDRLKTAGEVLVIFAKNELIKMVKREGRIYVIPIYEPKEEIRKFIEGTKYIPPMMIEPLELKNNRDTGYLTFRNTLLLGKGNHHDKEICLDSLNKFNKVPLSLNVELLQKYSESPPKPKEGKVRSQEQMDQWEEFIKESYTVYLDIINKGNKFWLTHKYDKRGRTYSQGHHVNYQSYSFKKAVIQLHKKELIHG